VSSGLVFWTITERLANWDDHPHLQEGRRKRMHNYRGFSLLSLPKKVYAKCFLKRRHEIIEPKLEYTYSTVFVLAVSLQTKFSLSRKLSRNLGSMLKTSTHGFGPRKDIRQHRCRSRQLFGGAKNFCANFRKFARKNPKKMIPKKTKKQLHFTGRIFSSQGASSTIFAQISPKLAQISPTLPKNN